MAIPSRPSVYVQALLLRCAHCGTNMASNSAPSFAGGEVSQVIYCPSETCVAYRVKGLLPILPLRPIQ